MTRAARRAQRKKRAERQRNPVLPYPEWVNAVKQTLEFYQRLLSSYYFLKIKVSYALSGWVWKSGVCFMAFTRSR